MNNHAGLPKRIQNWIVKSVDPNARILSFQRLKGSTSSTLHHVTLQINKREWEVVVRQFDNKGWLMEEPDLAPHEAESLRMAMKTKVCSPEIIAFDKYGEDCGVPAVLMTMLDGSVELKPNNMKQWVNGLAVALVKIHVVNADDFQWDYYTYNDVSQLKVPAWSDAPETWEKVIDIVQGPHPQIKACFIHRDYHPANVLWNGGTVSGVVDWVNACQGPAGIDVGHCRLNLALLYDVRIADEFLKAYQEAVGGSFTYEPYWDLLSLIDMLFGPPEVYPGWKAFGVTGLTNQMMEVRMDAYAISLLHRL